MFGIKYKHNLQYELYTTLQYAMLNISNGNMQHRCHMTISEMNVYFTFLTNLVQKWTIML